MNNLYVKQMLNECKEELESIKALLIGFGEGANPTPYIKKYAVMRASSSIETGFKTIIADRVDRDSHKQLKNFVARKIRNSSTNPKLEAIENLLSEFDQEWRAQFDEKIALSDKPKLKDSLTNLVRARNSFAHGGTDLLSIDETILYFCSGCDVLRILDETVHMEVELLVAN